MDPSAADNQLPAASPAHATPDAWSATLERCLLRDRRRLATRIDAWLNARTPREPAATIAQALARSAAEVQRRRALIGPITFDQSLPVVQRKQEIADAIRDHQVLILCGETGSGKTTQLPKICLELGLGSRGTIGHTQPRRVAARSVAGRLAHELSAPLGGLVGYKMRFTDETNADSLVKLMTDGILLAETQSDPLLESYEAIIIDEAHERSLNIDFLLGYLRRLQPRRPDLKIIITSATIDPQRFARHFESGGRPATIIEVSGRTYPVDIRYRPLSVKPSEEDGPEIDLTMEEAILSAAREAMTLGPGDMLVFLPGEREIRDIADVLRGGLGDGVDILPLYARLSGSEQMRVFQPSGSRRRIVLATNVAETSITVPGIRYVIDPGLARISRYSSRTRVQQLPVEAISQASANQRAGRCGRVGPGVCFRLFEEDDYRKRDLFTEPEILRTNLASVLLQMKSLRLGDARDFPFVEAPDPRAIKDGLETLRELQAVDDAENLTDLGRRLARLPLDPRLGRMLLAADREHCVEEVLVIAAALSIQDPRERPLEKQQQADEAHARFRDPHSDFKAIINIWRFYHELNDKLTSSRLKSACRQNFLSFMRLREWGELYRQLRSMALDLGLRPSTQRASDDQLHRALLTGLLTSVGCKGEQAEYTGCRNLKFHIHPGSGLSAKKPEWVMAAELVRTTRLYARMCARIDPLWIEQLGAHLVHRTYSEPRWKREGGRVLANERVLLHGLEIVARRPVHFGPVDPKTSREIFIENALVRGDVEGPMATAPFLSHNLALIDEIRDIEAKARRRDMLAGERTIYDFYDRRLPPTIHTTHLFEGWRKQIEQRDRRLLYMRREDIVARELTIDPRSFPAELPVFGSRLPLKYVLEPGSQRDGINVDVPTDALHQIDSDRSLWLVPGMLNELVAELTRCLPKAYRHHITNAHAFAEQIVPRLKFGEGSLLDAVARELRIVTKGLVGDVPRSAWRLDMLPAHLRFNYRVRDAAGRIVAEGRDLDALKKQFTPSATSRLPSAATGRFHRDGLTRWDFGPLPDAVQLDRSGIRITAYPTLVDAEGSCGLRLADSPAMAQQLHRSGLCRLFIASSRHEFDRLRRGLPDLQRLRLLAAAWGPVEPLIDDMLMLIADRALFADAVPPPIRDEAAFDAAAARAELHLWNIASEVRSLIGEIFEARHSLLARVTSATAPSFTAAVRDVEDQLARLLPPRFVRETPYEWLCHLPRYLTAARLRLERLPGGGVLRDAKHAEAFAPWWQLFTGNLHVLAEAGARRDAFLRLRWMLEEMRVSLYAQDLKTAFPVSYKRLAQAWEDVVQAR